MQHQYAPAHRIQNIVKAPKAKDRRQPAAAAAAKKGKGGAGGAVFPPFPKEDLVFRGGRTMPNMSFKTFYLGKGWASAPLAAPRQKLDAAIDAAMSDPGLNGIVAQYFGNAPITTKALPSAVLDVPGQATFDKGDIHNLVKRLFKSGNLAALDLKTTLINFVLPPRAVLSSDGGGNERVKRVVRAARTRPGTPEAEEEDSRNGLGGYHGSVHIQSPTGGVTVYYAAAVFSDGDNGIPISGWEPWENICATLYHELCEARTDPDVEDAIRTGDLRFIGWNSNSGQEIGDFPIGEAGSDLERVFKRVTIAAEPHTVPIQLMWSNRVHGPEAPGAHAGLAMAAALAGAATEVISLGPTTAATTAPTFGNGIVLSPPGNLKDFKEKDSFAKWSSERSKDFDEAIERTQQYLKGLPSQYFNPTRGIPNAPDHAEQPIKWPGFPRKLENLGLPLDEQFRRAEVISGTSLGRLKSQDEYLEWFVTRGNDGGIVRVDFTCEGPEYWRFLAEHEPKVLLALYQKHISPDVKLPDLITGKNYNPLNVWNTTRGAMHLIQPSNNLFAEIVIAGDATILRKNADGSLKTEAQDLIDCANYGDRGRASDPHIGDLVNALARDGYVISLKDPVGLYMSRPRLVGFTTPDKKPISQDWFTVARGSEEFILRGVFAAPKGSKFTAGDLSIGGVPLRWGGQVAKVIDMGLTGVAYGKGTISDPAFDCGDPPRTAVMAGAAFTDFHKPTRRM
ncbi:hypothetical protein JQ543_11485 [Bradyrhizobium diazoefficiens]|nr:hypothetical protein [Bradyrhizobium diazoefficiens]MBR0848363.1 hypothetical protein [Bradyrhizobium diazoefficiens]